jgi:hypothetical protein
MHRKIDSCHQRMSLIGDTQLSAVWTDPDFDPDQKAVYYVRVLEIPTPRWYSPGSN